ncbi:gluconate 2-dehydrogenase subunit 3 family protein [Chryseosolibacter indicus]|uniref:Gluconate 2-dehydrogenase subunit 3 family protein n=1 Tax=Chryseosolibacter indicus TaxID=2782351 RepID=A0ABS5VL93_9BACT|nr:gluconate 2-dehydrogenase subunit 3 family protein [Chryseosolibacter indicus]MBT1701876.1 gluconate 2-dehydrogenase subunit 3 family protein [Chryseosolibacter indicus]
MDRREAIRRTAWIMGGIVSAPAIAAVLKGCKAKPELGWKPVFLSEEQAAIVSEIAEIIIPKTDTPGAKDAGVPGFIDLILKDVYKKEDQDLFLEGLKAFSQEAEKEMGDSFLELSHEQQSELVKKKHDAAIQAEQESKSAQNRPFILAMKELTMLGFFTSEPGATLVLQYEPVPGAYKGCIPLAEAGNGRTWAT